MLEVWATETAVDAELKARLAGLEQTLVQYGKRVIVIGTQRPPKPSKADPLLGLCAPIVSETLKQFGLTDEDLERDHRLAWLTRSIVTGREIMRDLRQQIPALQKIISKLEVKRAAEAQPQETK